MDDKPVCATRKDLAQHARDHYEEISAASMWWSSIIPKAIDAWEREPDLQATADRRLELLKRCQSAIEYHSMAMGKYQFPELMDEIKKELSDAKS